MKTACKGVRSASQNVPLRSPASTGGNFRDGGVVAPAAVVVVTESVPRPSTAPPGNNTPGRPGLIIAAGARAVKRPEAPARPRPDPTPAPTRAYTGPEAVDL